jgi:5-methyltetrahydropteroyltriglutamate--homocysteine methyltransferase
MSGDLLPTTVVGSDPQPEWLIDREALGGHLPPRVRATELWRVRQELLGEAQDDATIVAIRDMERAGVDIISDGEQRRESYSNRVATALGGVDSDRLGTNLDRTSRPNPVPLVTGPIQRTRPMEVEDLVFLRRHAPGRIKMTVPGPFTMAQQAQNDYYADEEEMAMAYAAAVNEEIKELFASGADVVQVDEPYMQARPEKARQFEVKVLDRALEGVSGTTAVHLCLGYAAVVREKPSAYSFLAELAESVVRQVSIEAAQPNLDLSVLRDLPNKEIILGVLDLGDPKPETPGVVAQRIRDALEYVSPERLVLAPDCGMKYLPRDLAFRKRRALVLGATIVQEELRA